MVDEDFKCEPRLFVFEDQDIRTQAVNQGEFDSDFQSLSMFHLLIGTSATLAWLMQHRRRTSLRPVGQHLSNAAFCGGV